MTKRTAYLWGIFLILGISNHFFVFGQARFVILFVLALTLFFYWIITVNQFTETMRVYDPNMYHVFRDKYQGHYVKFAKVIIQKTCPNRFHVSHVSRIKTDSRIECQDEKILNAAKTVLEFYESGILLIVIVMALSIW